jgi:hypothetical protein
MGKNHASLARSEILDRVEAEYRSGAVFTGQRTGRAGMPALVEGARRVRAILDHIEAVPPGQEPDGVHIARQPGEVHGDDSPRLAGDPRLNGGWIDVSVRPHVRQHGRRTGVDNRVDCRAERQRGGNHFHPRANIQRRERQVQSRGA